jgi:hypothetical protein
MQAELEQIRDRDITVTRHVVEGFPLSYFTDNGNYYHRRYINYNVKDAKRLFREYVYAEESRLFKNISRDDV